MLMTRHFDYCSSAREGDNQSVRSSAPVVSRCFPGGYNVKLHFQGQVSMVVTGFFVQCKLSKRQLYGCAKVWFGMCGSMTPGLSKDIQCHV